MKDQIFDEITPISYGVLVEVPKAEEKVNGIYLPDSTRDKKTMVNTVGTILCVADSAFTEDHWNPKPKVGDTVLFEKLAGQELQLGDKNTRLIKDEQVRAIVKVAKND